MQITLLRCVSAALVVLVCFASPAMAGKDDISAKDLLYLKKRFTIAQIATEEEAPSPGAASDEQPKEFARRFITSCTNESRGDNEFFLSRIKIPLRYKFSIVGERGTRSTPGVLMEMRRNPQTGGFVLPICVGDGGLDETKVRIKGPLLIVELAYGSGPNEELHFRKFKGIWKLVFVEWIDH